MPQLNTPLAEQLRPQSLDGFIGQHHLVGKGAILRRVIESRKIPSMILWGPPGVGKTTLAIIIAKQLERPFYQLSAINSGVKEIREVIEKALESKNQPILFIDEIHRFSKSQQDSLLGAVERGVVCLVGATTENPSFEVISPLLSRCQIYLLKALGVEELKQLIQLAVDFYLNQHQLIIEVSGYDALFRFSGGDARKLYNAIELVIFSSKASQKVDISNQAVIDAIQQNLAIYDKSGEMHYDLISAFIKSLRGSDPNAAVYWLARMIEGGEDPLFIARRMVVLASEDIGNANPNALVLANACFQAVHTTGYPECRLILSQTAIYLACCAKSNASYLAIEKASGEVKRTGDLPVPLHLRNAPTKLMQELNYGKGYLYAHDFKGNFAKQDFLPESIRGTLFYNPQINQREEELRKYLRNIWKERYGY